MAYRNPPWGWRLPVHRIALPPPVVENAFQRVARDAANRGDGDLTGSDPGLAIFEAVRRRRLPVRADWRSSGRLSLLIQQPRLHTDLFPRAPLCARSQPVIEREGFSAVLLFNP